MHKYRRILTPALVLFLISALSKVRIVVSASKDTLSFQQGFYSFITDDVIPDITHANNTPPPDHSSPLALYSLLHRLHRLPAPDLPLSIPPLLPPPVQDPDRARNVTCTLHQSIQRHPYPASSTLRIPGAVPMGASRAIGIHESVPRVSEIPHRYMISSTAFSQKYNAPNPSALHPALR